MRLRLVSRESGEAIALITRVLPTLRLKRDYLKLDVDAVAVAKAEHEVRQHQEREHAHREAQESLASVESELLGMKKPKLFGKGRFEELHIAKTEERERLRRLLAKSTDDMKRREAEVAACQRILMDRDEKQRQLDAQYERDAGIFDEAKTQQIMQLVSKAITVPDEVIDGSWETAATWIRSFFRSDPTNRLFPMTGWESAMRPAGLMVSRFQEWVNAPDVVIIDGKDRRLPLLIAEFLMNFARGTRDTHDKHTMLIRANIAFLGFGLANNENVPDEHPIMRYLLLSFAGTPGTPYEQLNAQIRELRTVALADNDEETLTSMAKLSQGMPGDESEAMLSMIRYTFVLREFCGGGESS